MKPEGLLLRETLSLVVPEQCTLDLSHIPTHKEIKYKQEVWWRWMFTKHSMHETEGKTICMVIRKVDLNPPEIERKNFDLFS